MDKQDLSNSNEEFRYLPITSIIMNDQVRRMIPTDITSEAFQNFLNSIEEQGILEPVLVTEHGDQFLLIAGSRRFMAAFFLDLTEIPARLLKGPFTREDILSIQLIENKHRKNLNPFEEAFGYINYFITKVGDIPVADIVNHFITYGRNKDNLDPTISETVSEIEKLAGKTSRSLVNMLKLLNLPFKVQEALMLEKISISQGYIFAANIGHPNFWPLFEQALSEKISNSDLKDAFTGANGNKTKKGYHNKVKQIASSISADINDLNDDDLSKLLDEILILKNLVEDARQNRGGNSSI